MMRTLHSSRQRGFTLVEMIIVIVITGIIGGMVAIFIKAPAQGYVDSARRAEMTDIADTALHRITRDLRLALPNSVRVTGTCTGGATSCFIEFLPTKGGGRYRAGAGGGAGCAASPSGEELDFTVADGCFGVLGPMPVFTANDRIVVYNLGIPGSDAYTANDNTGLYSSNTATTVTINPAKLFPFDSPGHRFHVISTPVTYVCDGAGTLWRYWGYVIQDVQTKTDSIAELDVLIAAQGARARLATNVSACTFTYNQNVVAQRSGLVTMNLGITESGETVTLYNAAHVSNQP